MKKLLKLIDDSAYTRLPEICFNLAYLCAIVLAGFALAVLLSGCCSPPGWVGPWVGPYNTANFPQNTWGVKGSQVP